MAQMAERGGKHPALAGASGQRALLLFAGLLATAALRAGDVPSHPCATIEDDFTRLACFDRAFPRAADATEAAQWVDYCNNPGNRLRRRHGFHDPLAVKIWQIGNETSYHNGFDVVSAARKTVEFAKAMKNVDSSIKIIGWGDSGWARQMMDIAGEYIDYIAFHHGFHPVESRDNLSEMQRINESPLNFNSYRKDPVSTWNHLIYDGYRIHAVSYTHLTLPTIYSV